MIGVIAKLKIKEGAQAQFEPVANSLVEASRAEPGIRGYTLWRTEDPTVYAFIEYYEDEAAVEAHKASEHYRRIGRQLGEFLEGRPELTRLPGATS